MPSSSWPGAPILRATSTSSGAPSRSATTLATGTPPRGSASTSGSSRGGTCSVSRSASRARHRPDRGSGAPRRQCARPTSAGASARAGSPGGGEHERRRIGRERGGWRRGLGHDEPAAATLDEGPAPPDHLIGGAVPGSARAGGRGGPPRTTARTRPRACGAAPRPSTRRACRRPPASSGPSRGCTSTVKGAHSEGQSSDSNGSQVIRASKFRNEVGSSMPSLLKAPPHSQDAIRSQTQLLASRDLGLGDGVEVAQEGHQPVGGVLLVGHLHDEELLGLLVDRRGVQALEADLLAGLERQRRQAGGGRRAAEAGRASPPRPRARRCGTPRPAAGRRPAAPRPAAAGARSGPPTRRGCRAPRRRW